MLVKLENPAVLTKVIEIISELVTEVRMKISEQGLFIIAIDPANVSMVKFSIPKSSFSQFEADKEKDILGINLDSLKRILRRCSSSSSLIFEKKDNLLKIQIQDRIPRKFMLALLDVEDTDKESELEGKIKRLEFSSMVELSSNDLIDSIEDCSVVSDACSFIIEDNRFIIEAKGFNSARSEFSGDEATIQAENCRSKYSLEYLSKFIKASKLNEKTILKFANDHPLRMDIKSHELELNFILAPRVESED